MPRKNHLNHKLKSKFDRKSNYTQILSRIEDPSASKKLTLFKFSLAPACLALIILGAYFFRAQTHDPNQPNNLSANIFINQSSVSSSASRLSGKSQNTPYSTIFAKYSINQNLTIPADLFKSSHCLYMKDFDWSVLDDIPPIDWDTASQTEIDAWFKKQDQVRAQYLATENYILHSCSLFFGDQFFEDDSSLRTINISIARSHPPARCYLFSDENLQASTINNTPLTIIQWENHFHVTFNIGDIYYDIETRNITETELIQLLKSIL